MEVPRLGVKSELQPLAYATATGMPDLSRICDLHTAHGNAGSVTHWARPGVEPAFSRILVRFLTAEPKWELPQDGFEFQYIVYLGAKKKKSLFHENCVLVGQLLGHSGFMTFLCLHFTSIFEKKDVLPRKGLLFWKMPLLVKATCSCLYPTLENLGGK